MCQDKTLLEGAIHKIERIKSLIIATTTSSQDLEKGSELHIRITDQAYGSGLPTTYPAYRSGFRIRITDLDYGSIIPVASDLHKTDQ